MEKVRPWCGQTSNRGPSARTANERNVGGSEKDACNCTIWLLSLDGKTLQISRVPSGELTYEIRKKIH